MWHDLVTLLVGITIRNPLEKFPFQSKVLKHALLAWASRSIWYTDVLVDYIWITCLIYYVFFRNKIPLQWPETLRGTHKSDWTRKEFVYFLNFTSTSDYGYSYLDQRVRKQFFRPQIKSINWCWQSTNRTVSKAKFGFSNDYPSSKSNFRRLGDTPRRRGRYSRSSSRSRCSSRNSNYASDNEVVEELSECFRDLVKEVKELVRNSRDPSPTRQIDHSPRAISGQPQTIIHHVPQYQPQSQLPAPPTVVQPIISPPIMPYHLGHHPMAAPPAFNYSTYPGPSYHHAFQYAQPVRPTQPGIQPLVNRLAGTVRYYHGGDFSLRFLSKPDEYSKVKMLERVVFRTELPVDQ